MHGKYASAEQQSRPRSATRAGYGWWVALAVSLCSCQSWDPAGPLASSHAARQATPPPAPAFAHVQPAPVVSPQTAGHAAGRSPLANPADTAANGLVAPVSYLQPPPAGPTWPADTAPPPHTAIDPRAAREYLFDGGDHPPPVQVSRDGTVRGLQAEDTVAHFDTLDGRTRVEPSNRVAIYAPRFGAVRSVSGIVLHEQFDRAAGVDLPTQVRFHEDQRLATTVHQPIQAERYLGLDTAQRFRDTIRPADVHGGLYLEATAWQLHVHEDFQIIRSGTFDDAQKARLAVHLRAAQAWTADQAVQVVLDETLLRVAVGTTQVESVYRYELPEGKPRLRVIKLASRREAQPGDEVEFTIRYDNLGDQTIGNVTILDNLTTRLEYLPGTAESTRAAHFTVEDNHVESLLLQWELDDPLPVGEGGLVRFRCRVR